MITIKRRWNSMKREPLKLRSNSVNAMIAHTVIKQSFFIAMEAERRTGLFHPPYIRICIRVCVCTICIYVYVYVSVSTYRLSFGTRRVSFRARCIRHLIPQKSARGKRNDPNVYSIKICNVFRETRCPCAYWNRCGIYANVGVYFFISIRFSVTVFAGRRISRRCSRR